MSFYLVASQIGQDLVALPAFLPLLICPGYLSAWVVNLFGFRTRTIVERLFWSVPLSFAISPISTFLIADFLSLDSAVKFSYGCAVTWVTLIAWERITFRRRERIKFGWHPLGGAAILMALLWILISILSLVDIRSGAQVFTNMAWIDLGARLDWTQSILHSGVPPVNPHYLYKQTAPMRNYYLWYVVCAVVSRGFSLPVRAVLSASCVWSGFGLASLIGLYLKHLLRVGSRLRRQFIVSVSLLSVTGLDFCACLWRLFVKRQSLPFDLEWWSNGPIFSWNNTIFWSPNHTAGLVSGLFAFLLIWLVKDSNSERHSIALTLLAGCAWASTFGVSVFLTLGLAFVVSVWAIFEFRRCRLDSGFLPPLIGSCFLSLILISPLLRQLARSTSGIHGGKVLSLYVREMIPPEGLLHAGAFQGLASRSPQVARVLADVFLLPISYVLELGFCLFSLLIFMVPALRNRAKLTPGVQTLLLLAVGVLPLITFVRSGILKLDEFGFRVALLLQFSTLLLGSELIMNWQLQKTGEHERGHRAPQLAMPPFACILLYTSIGIGVLGTIAQAFFYRFDLVFISMKSPEYAKLYAHNPYVLAEGYRKLDGVIPSTAVVQPSPADLNEFRVTANIMNVGHQSAILSDQPLCGSELGGNPEGCRIMADEIDSIFKNGESGKAQAVCRELGINYLVSTVYDPVWWEENSWVWRLTPIVADPEFRALKCQ
jgi:hypothetical protein